MNPRTLIAQVIDEGAEWLEMAPCPATFVAGVLAKRVIDMQARIDYLEKRIETCGKEV